MNANFMIKFYYKQTCSSMWCLQKCVTHVDLWPSDLVALLGMFTNTSRIQWFPPPDGSVEGCNGPHVWNYMFEV